MYCENEDDSEILLKTEDDQDEVVTIENYEQLSTTFNNQYFRGNAWPHQSQAANAMLIAESGEDIITQNGDIYNSNFGILALPTGTGKTITSLLVAAYDVPERKEKLKTISTMLCTLRLKKVERQNISVTIICTNDDILNERWIPDISNFFGGVEYQSSNLFTSNIGNGMPYYKFGGKKTIENEVKNSPEYINYSSNLANLKTLCSQWNSLLYSNPDYQPQFELAMTQIDSKIKTIDDFHTHLAKKEEELKKVYEILFNFKIATILSNVRVAFITNDSFQILLNFFKYYTVSRLIFDEPQTLVLTNQKNFEDYLMDKKFDDTRRHFFGSVGRKNCKPPTTYSEESPARFFWYCTATPGLISDNDKGHYINTYVSRNEFITLDYIKHPNPNDRLYRELIARNVIKFPYSYILEKSRPDLLSLCRKITLKTKKSMQSTILRGVLDENIDNFLENDDEDAIKGRLAKDLGLDKLYRNGTVMDILDLALQKLLLDINDLDKTIKGYKAGAKQHVINESTKKLQDMIQKYHTTKKKIDIFKGDINNTDLIQCSICGNSIEHEYLPIEGESQEDILKRFGIVHTNCMNTFHYQCLLNYKNSEEWNCPLCNQEVEETDIKPFNKKGGSNSTLQQDENYKLSIQNNPRYSQHVENETYMNFNTLNKTYIKKTDALRDTLKPILDVDQNGNQFLSPRKKGLLFVEFSKNENPKQKEIIKILQESGFDVRLPFTLKNEELNSQYPPINGSYVHNPKTNFVKEIKEFMETSKPTIWLFRSVKESAGLSFPFVDFIVLYSKFKSVKQILGRGMRLTRVIKFDFIIISSEKGDDDGLSNVTRKMKKIQIEEKPVENIESKDQT